ncbi:MAG: nitrilase-related carbon-nitrogen hydrolase [Candidatus Methylomirabilales bacterium]
MEGDKSRTGMDRFTVAIAQMSPKLGDVPCNVKRHEEAIRQARGQGVDLLVFPELSLTGYFLKDLVPSVALTVTDPHLHWLRDQSRDLALVVGLVEESPDHRFFNTALFLDEGQVRGHHRKLYLPTYGMFDEHRYFAQGETLRAFDTRFGRMAILICEDFWHPSTSYLAAMDGATTLIIPSASPGRGLLPRDTFANAVAWERLNRTYAQTLAVFTIYANRVGYEDGACFWGGSEVIRPGGETAAKAPYAEEAFLTATLDQRAIRRERAMNPLLRDERLDLTLRELQRIVTMRQSEDANGGS